MEKIYGANTLIIHSLMILNISSRTRSVENNSLAPPTCRKSDESIWNKLCKVLCKYHLYQCKQEYEKNLLTYSILIHIYLHISNEIPKKLTLF